MSNEVIENCFSDWKGREETAEAMIPLIGRLYRRNNVVTSIYGRAVINQSVIGILKFNMSWASETTILLIPSKEFNPIAWFTV